MRAFALALVLSVTGSIALADPGSKRIEASAPSAGFPRQLVAETLPATFSKVKVSGEVGADR